MKIYKLKKNIIFSLITLIFCYILLYSADCNLNISGFIDRKIESVKENEMKFMFGDKSTSGDKYFDSAADNNSQNISYTFNNLGIAVNTLIPGSIYEQKNLLVKNQNKAASYSMNDYMSTYTKYKAVSQELRERVEKDSFRDRYLGFYYVFSYGYTMDALKELDPVIERTSEAQKIPKALVKAVLFREMMFIGQEDLLDGLPVIGGKSMGICQIGIENVRYNENTVHGKDSLLANKTDAELMDMLQNPEQSVYFCAVQLRARAIKLTRNKNVDLHNLNREQIHKVLEEYNQSKITKTIGPVKTKAKYADETYRYYELFARLYELGKSK